MYFRILIYAYLIILFVAGNTNAQNTLLSSAKPIRASETIDTIIKINPPLYGFYTKYLNCEGISIRSADEVDNNALKIASAKIKRMLRYMPATLKLYMLMAQNCIL